MVNTYSIITTVKGGNMKYEERYERVKKFLKEYPNANIQIDIPVKSSDERIVTLSSGDQKEEVIFSKKGFDNNYLFEILKTFGTNNGYITNKTMVNKDKYFIELKAGDDSSIYLNNFSEGLINKIRFYVNNQNRIISGRLAKAYRESAFISVSVLFVISLLSIVLVSMLVLAL